MARPSHVRNAICALVADSDRHDWTIDDVVRSLAQRGIASDQSSVFRGLGRLADDGLLDRVELGDGRLRFESPRPHHEHIRCERCGTVAEVPGCLLDGVGEAIQRRTGFRITGHRLLFSGQCPSCAGAAA